MSTLPDTRLVAFTALAVACFSAGFALTIVTSTHLPERATDSTKAGPVIAANETDCRARPLGKFARAEHVLERGTLERCTETR